MIYFPKSKSNNIKKAFVIVPFLLFAAGCSKQQPVSVSQNPSSQSQPAATPIPIPTPSAIPTVQQDPLTVSAYHNDAEHYMVLYSNYFKLYNSATILANKTKGVNFSACVPYGFSPDVCFVLNSQPYQNTNLESAAVAIKVLKNKKNINDCGSFTAQELNGGKTDGSVVGTNGTVFVTATTSDAGAGNYSETYFNRAFYGTICYELDETIRWANAGNFDPPKTEFNKNDVWAKLDLLRNGFQFVK